jgi:hypothetical protein
VKYGDLGRGDAGRTDEPILPAMAESEPQPLTTTPNGPSRCSDGPLCLLALSVVDRLRRYRPAISSVVCLTGFRTDTDRPTSRQ